MICRCRAVLVDDRVERDVGVRRLHVVGQLDVVELRAADDPLLLLDRERVPAERGREGTSGRSRSCRRRTPGPRRRSSPPRRPSSPSGFSVPSTKPSRSRSSKDRKPWTSSTTSRDARPAALSGAPRARSRGRAGGPGCGTAGRPASPVRRASRPRTRETGAARPGRGSPSIRSHRAEPIPVTQTSSPSGIRKPTDRLRALTSERRSLAAPSPPGSTVSTRKIAAAVSGVSTPWLWGLTQAVSQVRVRSRRDRALIRPTVTCCRGVRVRSGRVPVLG